MKNPNLIVFILVAVLCPPPADVQVSRAADPEDVPAALSDSGPESSFSSDHADGIFLTTLDDKPVAIPHPLFLEIRALLHREKNDVDRLTAHVKTLTDPLAVLEVHREISTIKSRTQVLILEAQGEFAHKEGRIELAAEIDAAIASMKSREAARAAGREVE